MWKRGDWSSKNPLFWEAQSSIPFFFFIILRASVHWWWFKYKCYVKKECETGCDWFSRSPNKHKNQKCFHKLKKNNNNKNKKNKQQTTKQTKQSDSHCSHENEPYFYEGKMVSSIDATRQQPPPLRTRLSAKMRVLSSEIVARRQKVRSKISVATSIISDRSSQYFPAKDGTSATSKLGTSRSTSRTIPERRPKKLPLSDTAPMTAETKTVPLSEMVKSSTDITPAEEALKGALKTIDSYLKKKYDSVSDRSFRTSKTKLLMEASSSMTEDDAACKQTR